MVEHMDNDNMQGASVIGNELRSSYLLSTLIVLVVLVYWHYHRWCQYHKVNLKGGVSVIRPPRALLCGHSQYLAPSTNLVALQRQYGSVIILTTSSSSWKDCLLSLDQWIISLWTLLTLNLSTLFPLSDRLQVVQDEILTTTNTTNNNNCLNRESEEMIKTQLNKRSCRVFLISDDALVRDIMNRRPIAFKRYSVGVDSSSSGPLSKGLYHAEGSLWLALRRMTTLSFSRQFLQRQSGIAWQMTEQWIQDLNNQLNTVDGRLTAKSMMEHDFYPIAVAFSSRFMLKIILGVDRTTLLNEGDDENSSVYYLLKSETFVQDVMTLLETSYNSDISCLSTLNSRCKTLDNTCTEAHNRIDNALSQILVEKLQQQCNKMLTATPNTTSTPSMLDIWLPRLNELPWSVSKSDSERLNEKVHLLIDNVKSIMISAVATSAILIAQAVHVMSTNSEICQRLREEADRFVLKYNSPSQSTPTLDALNELSYTDAFVNELLRLKSPSSVLGFEPANKTESATLVYGLVIQPQDIVLVHINAVMKNEEVFTNADQFQPDRWLIKDIAKRQEMNEHLLAFGLGTRVCPGMTLGKMHLYYSIVGLASRFVFHASSSTNNNSKTAMRKLGRNTGGTNEIPPVCIEVRHKS